MTTRTNIIRRAFALISTAAVAGLAAPAALADPPQGHRAQAQAEYSVQGERAKTLGGETSHSARFVPSGGASTSNGFAWDDAGIGAVVGFAFALLAAGALVALRTRGRVAHA